MPQKVYKKQFTKTITFEEMELDITGSTALIDSIGIPGAPKDMANTATELHDALHKEIDDFEREEGDITIVSREPRLFILTALDDGCSWAPAMCLEINVGFTHHDDKEEE